MNKQIIGCLNGVFDMFNINHLNVLKNAKEKCDFLIVGVLTDELLKKQKKEAPIFSFEERIKIVSSIRYVDKAVPIDGDIFNQEFITSNNINVMFIVAEWGLVKKERVELLKKKCKILFIDNSNCGSSSTCINQNEHCKDGCKIGYTTGVFDMFHIGHLNVLKNAKEKCDFLIVGVSTDENVETYKNKKPIVPFAFRKEIVEAIKYVDLVVPQNNMDKFEAWKELHFHYLFHGDDWKGSKMYNELELKLNSVGCKVIFLPHTDGISSTILRNKISDYSTEKLKN